MSTSDKNRYETPDCGNPQDVGHFMWAVKTKPYVISPFAYSVLYSLNGGDIHCHSTPILYTYTSLCRRNKSLIYFNCDVTHTL